MITAPRPPRLQAGKGRLRLSCCFWGPRAAPQWMQTSMGSTFIMLCVGCLNESFLTLVRSPCPPYPTEMQTFAVPVPSSSHPTSLQRRLAGFLKLTYPWDLRSWLWGFEFQKPALKSPETKVKRQRLSFVEEFLHLYRELQEREEGKGTKGTVAFPSDSWL